MNRTMPSDAFRSLVERCHADVFDAAMRVVHDAAMAEDVTQSVYFDLLNGRIDLTGAATPCRVLRWFASRRGLMALRSRRVRVRHEERAAMTENRPKNPEPIDEETKDVVRRKLAALPEQLGQAVALRYIEGASFEEMAQALSCSLATAHDRVRRGLERLRRELASAGFAQAALIAPEALAGACASTVPATLAPKLLALTSGGAGAVATGIAAKWLVAAAAFVLFSGSAAWMWIDGQEERERELIPVKTSASDESFQTLELANGVQARRPDETAHTASLVRAPSLSTPDTPSGTTPPEVAEPIEQERNDHATIVGRVVDPDDTPLEGVLMTAASRSRHSKMSDFIVSAKSAKDGRFELIVPVPADRPRPFDVYSVHANFVTWRSESIACKKDDVHDVGVVKLTSNERDVPGATSLTLTLTDSDGNAAKGVVVRMYRRTCHRNEYWSETWEAGGVADAGGKIVLHGKYLGEKMLRIDGRRVGYEFKTLEHSLVREGSSSLEINLERGLVIAGTVHDIDGAVPADWRPYAVSKSDPNEWFEGSVDENGRFVIGGLAKGKYDVRAQNQKWSALEIEDVEAGTENLSLRIKRSNDPRSDGLHLAEIHAVVRDAVSGEAVKLDFQDFDLISIPDVDDATLRRDVFPNRIWGIIAQREMGEIDHPLEEIHVTGIKAGTYLLVVHERGYAPGIAGPLRLGKSDVVKDLTVLMYRGAKLSGTVRDAEGRPVKDAVVFMTGVGPESEETIKKRREMVREVEGEGFLMFAGYVKTDAEGRYAFENIRADLTLRVVAVDRSHAPVASEVLPFEDGMSGTLDLRFE